MLLDYLKTAFVTLLVTIDPAGLAPIFIGLTLGMAPSQKREVALRAVVIAFGIMAAFGFAGDIVMKALGISLPAFRIAGGLLLFWIAFEMVFELRAKRKSSLAEEAVTIDQIKNIAAFPLAIPLMAGPGAITATILLAGRANDEWSMLGGLMLVIAAIMFISYACFLLSDQISRLLGTTGNIVLTRLLGVILAALAVQFVIDGVLNIGK
jgi:multiple antibiotic resistance protein